MKKNIFFLLNKLRLLTSGLIIGAALAWLSSAVLAAWQEPSAAPPDPNRDRPINVGSLMQEKSGTLVLGNDSEALRIRNTTAGTYVGFKASASANGTVWTLPASDGLADYVLATNGNGVLRFDNVANLNIVDNDWKYTPNSSNFTSIYSEVLTRVGPSTSTLNLNLPGQGDLYVQNRLEVDGNVYLNFPAGSVVWQGSDGLAYDNANFFWDNTNKRLGIGTATPNANVHVNKVGTNNAEIDLQSVAGAGNHWGLYVDAAANDLRLWQGSNQVYFTNTGRVGIGVSPTQALDVSGGVKLSGLLYGNGGAGSAGQILSRNATNIEWIDPTWWTNTTPSYIYSTKNTRIGNTGTVNYATGANDLYVQGNLEVDGQFSVSNLNLGFPAGSVIFHGASGLAYDNANFFWDNTAKHLGIGTATPADFSLQVAGNVGPDVNNTYNLGSATKRWANIFANNLSVGGDLSLNLTQGSVLFYGASGISQNNANFNWNDAARKLTLGSATTAALLKIFGNLDFAETALDKSAGVLTIGGEPFLHNAGKSILADPLYTTDLYSNTYLGRGAGSFPLAANEINVYDNTAVGFQALKDNAADSNTAFGSRALTVNAGGAGNTAVGSFALSNNLSGGTNSALGWYALQANTAGSNNAAVGGYALYNNTASNNAALGVSAMENNTSGAYNAALGYQSGLGNTTGGYNVFLGARAGSANTTGAQNIYIGYQTGSFNATNTGTKNIYVGYRAGYLNQTGTENVYVGDQAALNSTGSGNVFLGSGAGTNNTGSGSVFIGAKAGFNETASNKLYIENSNVDADSALISGQFYSLTTSPLLRFNAKLGIAPRGTTISGMTFPNRLLHIYQPSGDNAEIDIQSVSGTDKHWAIYNDRTTNFLTFWTNAISGENKNMLTLALNGPLVDKPSLGIGTGLNTPIGHVEIRSQAATANHTLTLSSFDQAHLGQFAAGFNLGSNIITFTGGRYRVEGDGAYEFKPSAAIWSGFGATDGQYSPSDFKNAKIAIQTLNNSGTLIDTIVAQNGLAAIGGGIDRTKNFRVYGSTMSAENWSDNGGTQKGGSEYVCLDRLKPGGSPASKRLRFEDGLYICSCDMDNVECVSNACTCNNPP